MAAAVALVGAWEGLRTKAYRDAVGVPTVCFGETRGVKMGDRYTVDECKAMLGDGLADFEQGIRKCLKAPDRIPDKTYVAFLSLAYNIGQWGFCKSSVARYVNAYADSHRMSDLRRACDRLLAFNKAGGRKLQGLVNRRRDEHRLCMEGTREKTVTGVE
ncbi:lysozyme [Methyloceanibacter caenitepidi]|uniref:Lysozyme n=2 Tax=Methyloceanibacter caenitepidi TaxID=1384459 RepID=A0A0A8JZV7_9HYPH|nr:lysozyme [Methyloceanibacter caenitepidi]